MIYATFIIFLVATALMPNFEVNAQAVKCGVNEARYPCGKRCEQSCNVPLPSYCKGMKCESYGCRCKTGYYRNQKTHRCIPAKECPKKSY